MEEIEEIGRGIYNKRHTGLLISVNGTCLFLFDNSNTGWWIDERYHQDFCKRFSKFKTAWWVDRTEVVLTNEIGEIK